MYAYSLYADVRGGAGAAQKLGEICAASHFGSRALFVADPFFADGQTLAAMRADLERHGIASEVFSGLRSDPDCTDADAGAAVAVAAGCDFVIALGGGSAIDAAKSAALVAVNGGKCWDYCAQALPDGSFGAPATPDKGALPVVALPTTAGTGSEVSHGSVISNRALGVKSGVAARFLIPRVSIVDPLLTRTLPPDYTAWTGFDAFCHAFEAYLTGYTTSACDAFSLECIRLFGRHYLDAVADGSDDAARDGMSRAATLGGFTIQLTDTSVGHVLGAALSARCHIPHGQTLSLTMDSIVDWVFPNACDRLARVAALLDPSCAHRDERTRAAALGDILRRYKERAGITHRLSDVGVTREDIPAIAAAVTGVTPLETPVLARFARAPRPGDLEKILEMSM